MIALPLSVSAPLTTQLLLPMSRWSVAGSLRARGTLGSREVCETLIAAASRSGDGRRLKRSGARKAWYSARIGLASSDRSIAGSMRGPDRAGRKVLQLLDRVRAERRARPREVQLFGDVAEQAAVARDHDLRRPRPGLMLSSLNSIGSVAGSRSRLGDVRVDAVDERARRSPRRAGGTSSAPAFRSPRNCEQPRADVALELASGRAAPRRCRSPAVARARAGRGGRSRRRSPARRTGRARSARRCARCPIRRG